MGWVLAMTRILLVDDHAVVRRGVRDILTESLGKVSFGAEKLLQNLAAFMDTLVRLKPTTSKGTYMKGIHLSTTMGPGIPVDTSDVKNLVRLL